MSIAGYSDPNRSICRRSLHWRDNSGELDVFEAAHYFSGYSDIISACNYNNSTSPSYKNIVSRDGDVEINGSHSNGDYPNNLRVNVRDIYVAQKKVGHGFEQGKDKITGKHAHRHQPSSPGGRLASFLNSLFSQTSSKRKKKSANSLLAAQSIIDHDEYDVNEGGGSWMRRRRSSISHFRSSTNMFANTTLTPGDAKSLYSSSSSGFRTPPPLSRSHKDLRSLSEYRETDNMRLSAFDHINRHEGGGGGDGIGSGFGTRSYIETGQETRPTGAGKREYLAVRDRPKLMSIIINHKNDEEENYDSDSSSDLFELQIGELGYCSSGLPVYETTRLDNIKRGPSMSSVAA